MEAKEAAAAGDTDAMNGSKVVIAILLTGAMSVCAQAKSRSAEKVNGVPNWDVTSSCRAAAEAAYPGQAGDREKGCTESENKTREKLVADWSTFPAEERKRCIGSIEWFSPTYTELAACLEMYADVRKAREDAAKSNAATTGLGAEKENAPSPKKPQR
jgi:hypothetical protein